MDSSWNVRSRRILDSITRHLDRYATMTLVLVTREKGRFVIDNTTNELVHIPQIDDMVVYGDFKYLVEKRTFDYERREIRLHVIQL